MKISEQWLRQWVDVANDVQTLADDLTMAGLEVDDIKPLATFTQVVVGEVIEVEPHPNADRLRVTQVDVGKETLQIVCGAPNVTQGMKAPVALVGAKLQTADGVLSIKKSKLRGVASVGMLCGALELGLEDSTDGLMSLPASAQIGQPLTQTLGLEGHQLDVSITPNRGDCFSVLGLARELSAIYRLPLQNPLALMSDKAQQTTQQTSAPSIKVTAVEACPTYLLQAIDAIDPDATTPDWMQAALLQCGLRTHGLLVDVTNYVLMETGQPLHAFDADALTGAVQVRLASKGESVTLLNDQTIHLQGDELVIADDVGILALAGIMGGKRGSIHAHTKRVVLEAAFFAPEAIAGRARRFGLHTDASLRFERGVDFALPAKALQRAVDLISAAAGGTLSEVAAAVAPSHLPKRDPIHLYPHQVQSVLGIKLSTETCIELLTALHILVEQEQDHLLCRPPSHRFDLAIPEDLIEEIARLHGYDNIPIQMPKLAVSMQADPNRLALDELKTSLAHAGYQEAISFSFSDAKLERWFDAPDWPKPLPLANPISSDLAVMRRTLLSSLLPCVQHNLNRQQTDLRFFEMGLSFVGSQIDQLVQTPSVALVATGKNLTKQPHPSAAIDFFDFKYDVGLMFAAIDSERIHYQASKLPFLHPGQSADCYLDGVHVGWLGQLHPRVTEALDLPEVWVAQLATDGIVSAQQPSKVMPPAKLPSVRRDLAFFVKEDISHDKIARVILEAGGSLLKEHWLFDVYQGKGVPEGQRSMAYALVWQDETQTLEDEAIQAAVQAIVTALENQFEITLRD